MVLHNTNPMFNTSFVHKNVEYIKIHKGDGKKDSTIYCRKRSLITEMEIKIEEKEYNENHQEFLLSQKKPKLSLVKKDSRLI